ncbi:MULTISPECIES: hypothetical protein [unclassified Microcoleus]|uniref:hypothetical protein n=1 Tax=unclassified Microcoleus TaxID=2642155 RepID=UPI0025E6AC18|nr:MULTISPECIES: hypothetical protein [unclassified Microcoleus]
MMGKTPQHNQVGSPTPKAGTRKAAVSDLAFNRGRFTSDRRSQIINYHILRSSGF